MDIRLDNRVALVTGGSLGLGRAMATEFARSGAKVAILARNQEQLDATAGELAAAAGLGGGADPAIRAGRVCAVSCDVADPDALAAAHQQVVDALGPVDILVNNAGTSAAKAFEDVSDEDWYHDLDLKFMAAVRLARLCIPAMKEQSWGRIINVLNVGAKAPSARSTPTTVSRAAGMALTKVLASELAPHGILVNALNTGLLLTNQWERMHDEQMPSATFDEFIDRRTRGVPLGRMGDPAEFANLACFLASDQASFITGTAINVDGGLSPVV